MEQSSSLSGNFDFPEPELTTFATAYDYRCYAMVLNVLFIFLICFPAIHNIIVSVREHYSYFYLVKVYNYKDHVLLRLLTTVHEYGIP